MVHRAPWTPVRKGDADLARLLGSISSGLCDPPRSQGREEAGIPAYPRLGKCQVWMPESLANDYRHVIGTGSKTDDPELFPA